MNKKGVEISMNVIIVAALGLLVLVVLSVIFLGRAGTFGQKTVDCEVQGGKCVVVSGGCGNTDFGTQLFPKQNILLNCADLAGEKQICCIPVQA
jgi:hypothetical protein